MADPVARAHASRRRQRVLALLALARDDVARLPAGERRDDIARDVGILERELATLPADSAAPPVERDAEAEVHELAETLHIADNACVYLVRAREQAPAANVGRAQRWLDRLRRDLATSVVREALALPDDDLVAAWAAHGIAPVESTLERVDRLRGHLREALSTRAGSRPKS